MNATLEQRLDSLTQMVETLAGAVHKNETPVKAAAPLPEGYRSIDLSTDICDYDFVAFESKRGEKVVSIVKAPASIIMGPSGIPHALLTVRMASGKTPLCKAPFVKGQTSTATHPAAVMTKVTAKAAPNIGEIEFSTIAAAAVNIEKRNARSAALQSFYGFTREQGTAYCANIFKPLLAKEPFPAGSTEIQKLVHLRGLLAKHVAPGVEQAATLANPTAAVVTQPKKAPLTMTAINARHQLEKELVPVRIDGKWTVPSIGAYEQEWIESPALQHEFPGTATSPGAKAYAAYRRRGGK